MGRGTLTRIPCMSAPFKKYLIQGDLATSSWRHFFPMQSNLEIRRSILLIRIYFRRCAGRQNLTAVVWDLLYTPNFSVKVVVPKKLVQGSKQLKHLPSANFWVQHLTLCRQNQEGIAILLSEKHYPRGPKGVSFLHKLFLVLILGID